MNAPAGAVVEDCTRASNEGRLTVPQQLEKLAAVDVEGYYADLRSAGPGRR